MFRKTGMRNDREVERARRAMRRCVELEHTVDEEEAGTVPTLPVLERLARALDADLEVRLTLRVPAA
ncbi:hypothetical protein [Nonomuraea sp. SYSU D8015]|uniref:hypothetical protein n=1 Tax=Nonomuraea sp. SYSU D8015 TaxID=2593644 RepID=UPI001660AB97|nr:hypothetical protein [Nonomuraea sp. SYSU D8015]